MSQRVDLLHGEASVSKLVYIIDFLSPTARFGGMHVKLLWVRVSDVKCVCHTLNRCELAGLQVTQCGQASVTLQPDSGLFNSLGAGVVKLTV